ncbi:BhlA/UviB family holin-like peptide [Bacillus sp. A17A.1]
MEEQIFNSMIQQGAFAALFVWMLFTTQKKNEQREEQYQKVIEKNQQVIEEQAKAFSSLSKDLSDVKQKILGNGMRNKI